MYIFLVDCTVFKRSKKPKIHRPRQATQFRSWAGIGKVGILELEFFLAFEEEKNFTPGPSRCVFSTFSVWRLTLLPPKETLWPPHRWLKNNEAQTISIILKTNICFFLHMLDCRVSSKSLIFFCKKIISRAQVMTLPKLFAELVLTHHTFIPW